MMASQDTFGVNRNRWKLSSYAHVTPIHPRSIDGKRPSVSMQMYEVRNLSTACWRLEAVAKRSCKLNIVLHYCCLPVKALLRYCRQSSTCSQRIPDSIHLHWGARSFSINWAWVDGRNVGVTTQYSSVSVHAESIYMYMYDKPPQHFSWGGKGGAIKARPTTRCETHAIIIIACGTGGKEALAPEIWKWGGGAEPPLSCN